MQTLKFPSKPGLGDATVSRWLKSVGQEVKTGEVVVELQSDRATVNLESNCDGVLSQIIAEVGTTVSAGSPIATIDNTGTASTKPAAAPAKTPKGPKGEVTPILMPKAGNTMEEGTIVSWKVKPGDTIKEGEVIFEVETDKATVEIEAQNSGRLAKIIVNEGDIAAVLEPVAFIAENDADVEAYLASSGEPADKAAPSAPAKMPEGPNGEVTPILMPKAGNTMEEGTIVSWKVKPGDTIKEGEVIFEVETDKATVEIEAQNSGRLAKIIVNEGNIAAVLEPVAFIAENDADVEAYLAVNGGGSQEPAKPAVADAAPPAPAPMVSTVAAVKTETGRVKASPAARKLATKKGVDLAGVTTASGAQGRIVTKDVLSAPAKAAGYVPAGPAVTVSGQPVSKKMSGMRKAIARNLLASKQNIPHFYIELTVDAAPMLAFYKAEKAKYQCSVNDVIVKACAKCIQEFPSFRSKIDGEQIVEYPNSNIGVAVGIEGGLVVPVIQNIEQMSLEQSAAQTRTVVENARKGKIEGMGTGIFTISNLGMFGIERFQAIINPPEAAILAVGAAREDIIVSNGTMRVGRKMTVVLSCDHRVIDGLEAAQFLARLKEVLESPAEQLS